MKRAAPYNRDAALDAAMSLFWGKGYHATSLKDLETTLKMKPGSIYAAFSSKEALYLLTLERYFETARQKFREQIEEAETPLTGLIEHIRSYARLSPDHAARQACMLMKTMVDTRSTEPAIAEASRTYMAEMRKEFASVFAHAKVTGEIPSDLDEERLAQRYQANVTALRFELHMGAPQSQITALSEDIAHELETLRKKQI
ncbi:TetR/AcrR family transcriptional regulator [Roseibium polysiphoniae]|uniref:TetR/AcrR family transcriptional regulator n=1 Tax=Roseibium polysiphoniae TaxID=2571221 RepID=UPI0032975FE9